MNKPAFEFVGYDGDAAVFLEVYDGEETFFLNVYIGEEEKND